MLAKDLMSTRIVTVREDDLVSDLMDLFVQEHLHGVPVVNVDGELVGIVTQQDVYFGGMTLGNADTAALRVRDIMTAPAVAATEDTEVKNLCGIMSRMRLHRIPILSRGKLAGMVSSLDVCAAVSRGEKLLS